MKNDFTPGFLSALRRSIVECFNLSELQNLCIDLGVDHEILGGEGKEAKARELITYLNRRHRLSELIAHCITVRPDYAWPPPNGPLTKRTILFLEPTRQI